MSAGSLRSSLAANRFLRAVAQGRVLLAHRDDVRRRPRAAARHLLQSRELSNFTYELANMDEIANCVAGVLGQPRDVARRAVDELRSDRELTDELRSALRSNPRRDSEPRFGYRYIYYCATRLMKPRSIVEVGVHDGLGSAVLLSALARNAAEGFEGRLTSLDQGDPAWLVPPRLRSRHEMVRGDALALLGSLVETRGCDFLIDDIGYGFPAKGELFDAALASPTRPLLIGSEFPRREQRSGPTRLEGAVNEIGGRYEELDEVPLDHFYPGHTQALALFGT